MRNGWQRRKGLAFDPPDPDRLIGVPAFEQLGHIVILTMSDHSYDNLFGTMAARGDGLTLGPSGLTDELMLGPSDPTDELMLGASGPAGELTLGPADELTLGQSGPADGLMLHRFRLPDTAQPHARLNSWDDSHRQAAKLAEGDALEAEQRGEGAAATADGNERDWRFGYWTAEELPFCYGLAMTFPLATRWFSSCLGPELPNRRFLIAGTANGVTSNMQRAGKPRNGTIFDLMSRHRVSWAIFNTRVEPPSERLSLGYQLKLMAKTVLGPTGLNVLRTGVVRLWPFMSLRWDDHVRSMADVYPIGFLKRQRHVQGMDSFARRARDGTLPAISFVDPDYSWFSGAPPQDVAVAESFVAQVVEAVMHGRGWARTLLILLHDSHGGYFDHVLPPSTPDPDAGLTGGPRWRKGSAPVAFDRLGFRVPAVIISPYAKPAHVTAQVYDHTSVLKLIELQWNLPPLTIRDASANSPLDALDFENPPAFITPPTMPWPADRTREYRTPAIGAFKADSLREFVIRVLQVLGYGLIGYAAFLTKNAIVESVVVYATALIAARLVIQTGFWRNWAFWQPNEREQTLSPLYGTALALMVLTVFVTLLSSELYLYGPFLTTPAVTNQVPLHFLANYVWNIFDAIPGLRITDTFNWRPPLTLADPAGRSVLIAYRLLVLAPVINLVIQLIQPKSRTEPNADHSQHAQRPRPTGLDDAVPMARTAATPTTTGGSGTHMGTAIPD
jgi:phospholipase C